MLSLGIGFFMLSSEPDFGQEARESWFRIKKDYFSQSSGLYREFFSEEKPETDAAFNWTVGIVISAMNSVSKMDSGKKSDLSLYLEKVELYWNSRGPVAGYDVIPNPPAVDRYYDDNAWMALSLLESYKILHEEKLLVRAKGALDFALSGEDEKLGGGIYWRESDKASKNTCSNSPVAVACFEIYEVTHEEKYKRAGIRLLNWTMANLYDEKDGLMWDNINLEKKIGRDKWSYNAALTVRALSFAEKIGHKYPISSQQMFESAWKKWHDGNGGLSGPAKFSHLLFEAGLKIGALDKEQIKSVGKRVLEVRRNGRWGGSLNQIPAESRKRYELIDESSAVRLLGLAHAELNRRENK